ncbi:MAG: ABC transporter permease [Opitutae bacterium]|nr:ABC transporter permease [Opitutae bacterium]
MRTDLRLALRLLAKSPGFTAAAVAVFALGIGINAALFSVVRELVFSPRPYPDPGQVVQVFSQDKKNPLSFRNFSYRTYCDLREHNTVFAGLLAHNVTMVGVGQGAQARRAFAAVVSSSYFSTLGVALARGRAFLPEEERPGANLPVVIVSHVFWQRTGADPGLVGRTLRINGRAFTVVGIAPEGFSGTMMLLGPEFYFPLGVFDAIANDFQDESHRTLDHPEACRLFVVGRLKPGFSAASAAPALAALAARLAERQPPALRDQTFLAGALPRLSSSSTPAAEGELGFVGVILLATGGAVLLVAGLNLAGMLLARGATRRREFAVRLALGAGRARLVRQVLAEGLVLALAGGLLGLVLALWSTRLLAGAVAAILPVPLFFHGGLDGAVFAATLGFCLLATLFAALGPALRLARANPHEELKQQPGGPRAVRRSPLWPRHPLLVAQLALSLVLLAVAGMFVHSAYRAATLDLGFQGGDDTIVIEANAALGGHSPQASLQAYRLIGERLGALPGVRAASLATTLPLGTLNISRPVRRFGVRPAAKTRPASAAEGLAYNARWNSVGAGYFATMGLPVLRGRPFSAIECDAAGAPAVAIIDEVLARQLWPGGNALGQRISFARSDAPRAADGFSVEASAAGESEAVAPLGETEDVPARPSDPASLEIVGLVPAVRGTLFHAAIGSAIYVPFAQGFQSQVYFHVRPAPSGAPTPAALRREASAVAPGVQVFKVQTFRQHLDASADLWIARGIARVFALLGALALVLAAVSVHGTMAYLVACRTREIGIRLALGADRRDIFSLIMKQGAQQALFAMAAGLLLSLAAGRLLATMLYRVSPADPLALAGATVVLAAAALLACWLPARRAAKVSPLTALRIE